MQKLEHIQNSYLEQIIEVLESIKYKSNREYNYSIAVDCLNGAMGELAKKCLQKYEHLFKKLVFLRCGMSGDFTDICPDPSKEENLSDLFKLMDYEKLDFALAFDGDGDRLNVIINDIKSENKKILQGDEIMMFLLPEYLKNSQDKRIIIDVKSSSVLQRKIEELGCEAIVYKTGHSLIKEKMVGDNIGLAGEKSGHIYYKERGFDDGLFAVAKFIKATLEDNLKILDRLNTFERIHRSNEIEIDCQDKFSKMAQIKQKADLLNLQYNDIDGIRINIDEFSWLLIRASNTREILTVIYESNHKDKFKEIDNLLKKLLKNLGQH